MTVDFIEQAPLYIFVYGDVTLNENGAQYRICEQIRAFSQAFPGTVVYSYEWHPSHPWTEAGEDRFREQFPEARLVLDRPGRSVRIATRIKNSLISLLPGLADRWLALSVPRATPNLARMQRISARTPWLINYVDGLGWLNGVPRAPIIVETHDIKSVKFARRYGQRFSSLRVMAKLRSEVAILARARVVVAIGFKDAEFFRTFVPEVPTLYVPIYRRESWQIHPNPKNSEFDLLFVASENPFNIDGFLQFWTASREWLSDYRIGIAGRICEVDAVRDAVAGAPEVQLLGFVDNLAEIYAASKATLSPVDGTGLKIKVVEALAHGRPVFASPASLDGLPPGYEKCVLPLERQAFKRVLNDPIHLLAAQQEALLYYERMANAGDRETLFTLVKQGGR